MSVVAAVDILGYESHEIQLVYHILQNIHSYVRACMLVSNMSVSIQEVFLLATMQRKLMAKYFFSYVNVSGILLPASC
jgi:hypothetical protein